MGGETILENGRIATPERVIEDGCVVLSADRITHVEAAPPRDAPSSDRTTVDVGGRIVMPGLIDLHGDDVEHQLHPRAGARVDVATAVAASDRFNVCNGVTTKFHAIAFEDDLAENRSIRRAAEVCREIARADYTLADNRVHARCELAADSVSAVRALLEDVSVDLVSMMRHVPGDGQFDEEGFQRHYTTDRTCSSDETRQMAAERRATPRATLRGRIDRIADLARREGIPLASHDDDAPETVDEMAAAGVTISEYPVTLEAAERASERELTTAMGAPNLVRGESLWGNLDVRSAIQSGALDVLCSDYHPPSMLQAPFVDTGEPFVDRLRRVTVNPADAVGLTERGRIEPGTRADVLVVDPDPVPTVERAFVAGRDAIRTG